MNGAQHACGLVLRAGSAACSSAARPRMCTRGLASRSTQQRVPGRLARKPPRRGKAWRSSVVVRVGLPFLGFITVGYWGLSTFVASKVERGDAHVKKQSAREFEMEEERKAMLAKLNLDELVIKPVPRPAVLDDDDDDDDDY